MKLLELGLIAYGPFTDVHLDFKTASGGFQLIYGPNEAGKSSALRAIAALLYGIPERSPDNFRHAYNQMRIRGLFQSDDGRTLEVIRRKGRRDTLRGADDVAVVDESILKTMTGDVDLGFFKTMFGIDHEDLVRGGEEILNGEGRIGRIIFAAGAGISNLRSVEERIKAEADTLFLPSGKKPQINHALAELKQINKAVRQHQLSADEWHRHERDLENTRSEKGDVEKRLDGLVRRIGKLRRIRDALPLVSTRKNLRTELRHYEKVPDLDADFITRRRDLTASLTTAESHRRQSEENLHQITSELEGLAVPEALLLHAELLETLFQELGGHRKAANDRSQLETRLRVLRSNANEYLRRLRSDLPLDQVDEIRLDKSQIVGIRELGNQYIALATGQEKLSEELSEIAPRLAALKAAAAGSKPLPDTAPLRSLAETIGRQGDLEGIYEKDKHQIDQEAVEIRGLLTTQIFWKGSTEALPHLALPRRERIDPFDHRFTAIENQVLSLKDECEKAQAAMIENARRLGQIEKHQAVPTEADLHACRQQRERNWQIIRKRLQNPDAAADEGQNPPVPPDPDLIQAYETDVKAADEMSDRMRREADRVALKVTLLADKAAHEAHLAHTKARLEAAELDLRQLGKQWSALWEPLGITPEAPTEMRAWAQEMKALAARAVTMEKARTALAVLYEKMETYRSRLVTLLAQLDEKPDKNDACLTMLMDRARAIIERVERERLERAQRSREISDLIARQRHATAKQERILSKLTTWRAQWQEAVAPLGLGSDATPDQATAVLEEHQALFETLREAGVLEKRIAGIDRDAAEYAKKVDHCAKTMAPDMAGRPVESIVQGLHRHLQAARVERTRQLSLEKQARAERNRKQKATAQINEIQAQLHHMCREAGCTSHEALPAMEQRSLQRRELEQRLRAAEDRLLQLAGGDSLDTFLKDVAEEDPDAIGTKLQQLEDEEKALVEKKSALDQRIGSARTELSRMDGNEKAAQLAQEAQSVTARIENDVERYARLRISMLVLQKAVERYRDRHQGPILERSGALFRKMTCESFQGLRAEVDASGEAAIMGFRPGTTEMMGVAGMSDGTTDQLYLAIRLASLEAYLESHESMPLILDDILIHFDNHRAAATLQTLADLSNRTQIIFFTHHRHLVDLAKASVPEERLVIHGLG